MTVPCDHDGDLLVPEFPDELQRLVVHGKVYDLKLNTSIRHLSIRSSALHARRERIQRDHEILSRTVKNDGLQSYQINP